MKKLKKLSLEDIEYQMSLSFESVEESKELEQTDFYQINDVPLESQHSGYAMDYFSIACGYSLKADYDNAKHYFRMAAEFTIKPFKMAYDEDYPDYVGRNIQLGYRDVNAINGFNYAMCTGDLELARQACGYYRYTKSDDLGDMANNYIMALQALFSGDAKAAGLYCQKSLEDFHKRPSKGITYRSNYFTLHLALFGILTGDQDMFDDGINKQLQMCHKDAISGEEAGTMESQVSDFSVALTNLALVQGLTQRVFDDFIPQGLIISSCSSSVKAD